MRRRANPPQFQVAFPDTYILEADAQSKLDFSSSSSSAKPGSQTPASEADNAPSLRSQHGGREGRHGGPEFPQSYEYMVLADTPYLCSIPQVEEEQRNETKSAADEADEQKELDRARARGSELIGTMDDNCLYYISGWWSYSFCYNSEVKQFHQLPPGHKGVPMYPPVEDNSVPAYILGQYNEAKKTKSKQVEGYATTQASASEHQTEAPQKATDLVQVQSKGNLRYLVQKLDDGTTCDLTGRPRRIEVQYHCNPQTKDRISWIKEISTCSYLMVVYTSRLCDDVAFSPPQENEANKILCQEIVPEEKLEAWKSRKAEKKLSELVAKGEAALEAGKQLDGKNGDVKGTHDSGATENQPKGVIIGGIELGGMKTVGLPGKRIEPPAAFAAPAKEKAVKTDMIAQFDPKRGNGKWQILSDRDLEKLGVDPTIAKEMAEEMYAYEKEKKWRLEVAHTAEGGELRGIIDDDDASQKKTKSGDDGSEEELFKDEL